MEPVAGHDIVALRGGSGADLHEEITAMRLWDVCTLINIENQARRHVQYSCRPVRSDLQRLEKLLTEDLAHVWRRNGGIFSCISRVSPDSEIRSMISRRRLMRTNHRLCVLISYVRLSSSM